MPTTLAAAQLRAFFELYAPLLQEEIAHLQEESDISETLTTPEEASRRIEAGECLVIAGSTQAMAQLPAGNWIGGSTEFFMTPDGGLRDTENLLLTTMPAGADVFFATYGPGELTRVAEESPLNGYSLVIIPAGSCIHREFANDEVIGTENLMRPLVGWISGSHSSFEGEEPPSVFDGRFSQRHRDAMVVAHVTLPPSHLAELEIVNIFEPEVVPLLTFPEPGFSVRNCTVNGRTTPFAAYLQDIGYDPARPLIGDFGGAPLNVSIKEIESDGTVQLYAPTVAGVTYRLSKPIGDYGRAFRAAMAKRDLKGVAFSCNCILNYRNGNLEGDPIGGLAGPVTFGEIGYHLLNQTMVLLRIH